jgi:2-polyprenyl-3-methyl-5-hydroxy-6-metoxy-1,4-benzoquinol methylase
MSDASVSAGQANITEVHMSEVNMSEVHMSEVNISEIKRGMRAAWMAGDFGVVAKTISGVAEAFIEGLPVGAGMTLLDVACGTGNTAIPAARKGAVVTGVDIATNLLEQARERAAAEGLTVSFDEGDAEGLPYRPEAFDAVTTMFGAMFAPRYKLVASEMARVLKPGGWVAMANWNPASFTGRMFKVTSKFVPAHAGIAPPVLWGDEATVRERLEPHFEEIQTELVPVDFDMPVNPAGAVTFFRKYFGPTQMAFSRLDAEGQAAMEAELVALWADANVADTPETRTLIKNEYLKVTGRRR